MVSVAITSVDNTSLRAAAALAGHRGVERVGLVGRRPPPGWGLRMIRVSDPSDWDIQLDSDIAATSSDLALALAARLDGSVRVAVTRPGKPIRRGSPFTFPQPLGRVVVAETVDGIEYAPVGGPLAAVGVADRHQILSIIDDRHFLQAVCMAATALTTDLMPAAHPEMYLSRCQELGLVIASAAINGG